MITELEAHRRQAAATLDKLNAPQRAAALAEAQIADLDEQIGQAKRAEQEARKADQQRASDIAGAWHAYNAVSDELRDALRSIHVARLRLVAYGVGDPGDRSISAEAIAAPLIERDRSI